MKKRFLLVAAAVVILAVALQLVTESSSQVDFYGQTLDINTRSVTLSGDEIGSLDELRGKLRLLPKLEYIDLGTYSVPYEESAPLRAEFPGVVMKFSSFVTIYGKHFDTATENIDLSDVSVTDTDELLRLLPCMGAAKTVDLNRLDAIPHEKLLELETLFPQIRFGVVSTYDVCGVIVREDAEEIDLSGVAQVDLITLAAVLDHFPALKKVDFSPDRPIPAAARNSLRAAYPGVEFNAVAVYEVCGVRLRDDAEAIDLSAAPESADLAELTGVLDNFYALRRLTIGEHTIPLDLKRELIKKYPDVEFDMTGTVDVCGVTVREDDTALDLSGIQVDGTLAGRLTELAHLKKVSLRGCGLTPTGQLELAAAFPGISFDWDVSIAGKSFEVTAERADLGGAQITDFNELRSAIRLMPGLKYLDLSDCGRSNEELAAFRAEYDDIKIVWRLYMGKWSLMTDAVTFSVLIYNFNYTRLTNEDIEVLKYCTDLRALDIGHQAITDLSVIGEYLTELRVLIIADNKVSDLSPLANLKHLHYLEFFVNRVTDLSPLAECRELVDLNISYNYGIWDITPLLELPLLERLWLESCPISDEKVEILRERYPNSKIVKYGKGSVDQGWRTHERYYNMIDMFHRDFLSWSFIKYDNKTESLLKKPLE